MKPTNTANLLFLAVIFFWFAQYIYIPFQTPYLNSIGAGAGMIGLIVGAYGISQMALRLPVGVLADRQNRHKQLIILGGASSGLASMFRVVMQNETGFLIGNLFSGLASAMWISFMVLYMSFYSEAEQRKATGKLILANNLGMLMGFVVSTLTYEIVGMRIICLSSVMAGILCVLCAAKLPAGESEACTVTIRQQISVCKSRNLLVFSLLALVQQGVQMSTTMSFTAQVIEGLGAKGLMIGISSVIYMMSGVLWARFASTESCGRDFPGILYQRNLLYFSAPQPGGVADLVSSDSTRNVNRNFVFLSYRRGYERHSGSIQIHGHGILSGSVCPGNDHISYSVR